MLFVHWTQQDDRAPLKNGRLLHQVASNGQKAFPILLLDIFNGIVVNNSRKDQPSNLPDDTTILKTMSFT